MKKTLKEA